MQKCATCIAPGTSLLHPPAADCVLLMVNLIRECGKEETWKSGAR